MKSAIRFKWEELVEFNLRALFEKRGFRGVSVNKFEDYGLYIDNKNFLQSEQIITFMDMDGKLLALKPDVTLSIVKNIPKATMKSYDKLYYVDEVYRLSKENREYKVLNQIGVELIGPIDSFSCLEIIDLALQSLATISDSFVLDISHLGFVSGLLDQAGLSHGINRKLLACIHAKSAHEVGRILDQTSVSPENKDRLVTLCGLYGPLKHVLRRAEVLVCNPQMEEAYNELVSVYKILEQTDMAEHVNLDFSVVNDADYYNGLIFLGYVEDIPGVVLTGGRYDNLMMKMGKRNGAVGFAVGLSELSNQKSETEKSDFDYLITYGSGDNYATLLQKIRHLNQEGFSVRLEQDNCDLENIGFTYDRHFRFIGEHLCEVKK